MLLTQTRGWPWGLVMVGDPTDRRALPTLLHKGAATTGSTVVSCIQHEVDGACTATVGLDEGDPELIVVHRSMMAISSGRLRMGDVVGEETQEAALPSGAYAVTVSVDDPDHPSRVHFDLRPEGG